MIIVTLVATLAAAMVWQQWRAVQVEAAERARAQSAWILSGALDFAKRILKEDKKTFTALTEPWATPLAEARISTFLAADKSNADDGPEAFLSGNISDAQARYNLRNLVTADKVDAAAQLATLAALCQAAGVETGIAQRIADGMRDSISGTSAAAGLRPEKVAQLTWLGIDMASIDALQPYVVILPDVTVINVNTASKEVIAAVTGVDVATAEHLTQVRQRTPFKDAASFVAQLPAAPPATAKFDVRSFYFIVRGRLRLEDRVLVEQSLVQKQPNGDSKVLLRERVSSLEQIGG